MYIFVYGTLRRGGGLHGLIDGMNFVGMFKTKPIYTLYEAGCPCLSLGGTTQVVGEIYSAADLSQLSRFHFMELGAGYSFEKVEIEGFPEAVFAYLQKPGGEKLNVIKSGDYLEHSKVEIVATKSPLPDSSLTEKYEK